MNTMNKLKSLTQLFGKLHHAERTEIYCEQGKIMSSARLGYSYQMQYMIHIELVEFTGNITEVLAEVMRWIRIHEPDTQTDNLCGFEIKHMHQVEGQDTLDLNLTINATEKVVVIEDPDSELVIDTLTVAS